MATAAKSSTAKWVAGGVLLCLGGAAIALGVIYGTKENDSLRGSTESTDNSGSVSSTCSALEIFSTNADSTLDGTMTGVSYGSSSDTCCTTLSCPYASILTYSCTDAVVYGMQCCTDSTCTTASGSMQYAYVPAVSSGGASMVTTLPANTVCTNTGAAAQVTKCATRSTSTMSTSSVVYKPSSGTGGSLDDGDTTPAPGTTAPVTPATPKPTPVAVTVAPTAAITAVPTTPAPTLATWVVPANETCTQLEQPPGTKVGGCLQYTCLPKQVSVGSVFHVTTRWCLTRPRHYHFSFDLLNRGGGVYPDGSHTPKTFFNSLGFTPDLGDDMRWGQCGEHTTELTFQATKDPVEQIYDVMWKFFITPVVYEESGWKEEPFPNMLAESGIDVQPGYGEPTTPPTPTVGDCEILPTREWVLPPTGKQDAIEYPLKPACITPGVAWSLDVKTHMEANPMSDLHCNLQLGTGGDVYLGREDVYISEADDFGPLGAGLPVNTVADYWVDGYWTRRTLTFPADQTKLLQLATTDKNYAITHALKGHVLPYIVCFIIPHAAQYNTTTNLWPYTDLEYLTSIETCTLF